MSSLLEGEIDLATSENETTTQLQIPCPPNDDSSIMQFLDVVNSNGNHSDDFNQIHETGEWIPYKSHSVLQFIYIVLCVVSLGIVFLMGRWFPRLKLLLTHRRTKSFEHCDLVFIECRNDGSFELCPVTEKMVFLNERANEKPTMVRFLFFRRKCFVYESGSSRFMSRKLYDRGATLSQMRAANEGSATSMHERALCKVFYGENSTEIPVKNMLYLLLDEILHPFYLFQLVSVIIWMCDEYYLYSSVIILSSVLSVVSSLMETRSNLITLNEMSSTRSFVDIVRNRATRSIQSDHLVPGDVVVVREGMHLACDMVLLSGQCLIDESMLTGEGVPVMKTPVPHSSSIKYDPKTHSAHTLFSGTKVLQTTGSEEVYAVCSRTGFDTTKGKILLSILYPKSSYFSFYRDSFIFIGIMSLFGLAGIIYSVIRLAKMGVPSSMLVLRALDVITIVVPPALPMAMTVGISFAVWRLKRQKIYCIAPSKVNVAGKLTCMCFDKTGTLTEPGVELVGVWPKSSQDSDLVSDRVFETLLEVSDAGKYLAFGLLGCNNLVHMKDVLVGDPMEVEVFKSIKGQLINAGDQSPNTIVKRDNDLSEKVELEIITRFEFQSSLQRMSVIAQDRNTERTYLLMKGSPEIVHNLSDRSTLPDSYADVLQNYVSRGYRVLAVAFKEISPTEIDGERDALERDVSFLGLVVLQNNLKRDTISTIQELKRANINTVMVTGDNAHTALAVARHSGIIDSTKVVFVSSVVASEEHLHYMGIEWVNTTSNESIDTKTLLTMDPASIEVVVSGSAFDYLVHQHKHHNFRTSFSDLQRILLRCHVYARMSPNQKLCLVEQLQNIEYSVGFCGDGVNDTSALSGSDVGLSLSEVETGMSAPFTSLHPTISCVPKLIREGRAALSLSFQLFKFMSCYSFIQFFAVILLYRINSDLGDSQFLFIDIAIIMPVVFLTSYTEPVDTLSRNKPSGSLLSIATFASMLFQLVISFGIQALILLYLSTQSWFIPLQPLPNSKRNVLCAETTSIFLMATYQTIGSALSYSISKPFKKPLYTNLPYLFSLAILFCCTVYITFAPDSWTRRALQLADLPFRYQLELFCFGLVQIFLFTTFEYLFIAGKGRKWITVFDVRKQFSGHSLYKQIS